MDKKFRLRERNNPYDQQIVNTGNYVGVFYPGICWLKQCKVPKPHIKSMEEIPIISLSGKQSAMVFKAILSLLSLNVGTKTQLFKIRKLA